MASTGYIAPEVVQGTTTSWLPMTTAYPSVAGCSDAFFLFPGQPAPYAFDPGYGYFAGGTLRCLPPQVTSWWELPHQNPDGYTSLSIQPIVCPSMHTTAVTEIRDSTSTLVMCCPSEYTVAFGQPDRVTGLCVSPLSSGQILPYTAQADNGSWVQSTWTITSATTINAVGIIGYNVDHSADTSIPTSSASSSAPSSTAAISSSTNATGNSGLSTGAKAGIGVGVAVVALAAIIAVFFFFRRRSQARKHHVQPQGSGTNALATPHIHEKSNTAVYEMHQGGSRYNMQPPVELSSNQAVLVRTAPERS